MTTLAVDHEQTESRWPTQYLFGVPICALTMEQVLSVIDETIESRGRLLIGAVNAAKIVNMRGNAPLREAVLKADLVIADGAAVVWASRVLRKPLPERVTGIDLMVGMLKRGDERGYRIYCLGATTEVLEAAVSRIRNDYPGLVVAGYHHGYFSPDEETKVVEEIRATAPDILLVAMSPPKKEQFLARWSHDLAPVGHGVGGALDVLAGKVDRAPEAWQRWGMEWLYRVKQEPGRLWRRYLVTNSIFLGMVVGTLACRPRARRPSRRVRSAPQGPP